MTRRTAVFVSLAGALTIAAGAVAAWSAEFERGALLALLTVIIPAPIVIRIAQRRWDPFEPIVPISVGLFFLFVLRPLAHLAYGDMLYRGFDITPGFNGALTIGLVGTVAVYAGYAATRGTAARRLRPLPDRWDPTTAGAVSVGLLAVGLLLYAGFALQAGGVSALGAFLQGRSPADATLLANSSAYLYSGAYLAIPATLLLLESRSQRRSIFLLVAAALTGFVALAITAPRGDRSWLMPLALGVIMLPYLRRGTRPRPLTLAIAGLISLVLIVFFVDFRTTVDRNAGASQVLVQSATGLGGDWKKFILGPDTEMFSVVSLLYERTPQRLPHDPGITVTSLLAAPVPRQWWSDKPFSADYYIFSNILPFEAAHTRAGTSPSMFGGFFYDSGFVGLALYGFLIGAAVRTLFEYFRAYRWSSGVRLFYAASFPLVILLLRGNLTDMFPRALYLVAPLVFALWVCSRRLAPSESASGRPRDAQRRGPSVSAT